MKHIRFSVFLLLLTFISASVDAQKIGAPVSVGELFDKITILEIKAERFTNETQRNNVIFELTLLNETVAENTLLTPAIAQLKSELLDVNKKLWDIEDAIREKEAQKTFDAEFIALARSVYFTNDERCHIKREINVKAGSQLIEEKQYRNYT